MSANLRVRVPSWLLAASGALALGALFAGCGVDELPTSTAFRRADLSAERNFRVGDVQVEEQLVTTASTVGTIYHLRAQVLNLGADLVGAHYDLVVARVIELPGGATELQDERIADSQALGTFVSGRTSIVSLDHTELGGARVSVFGRFAPGP